MKTSNSHDLNTQSHVVSHTQLIIQNFPTKKNHENFQNFQKPKNLRHESESFGTGFQGYCITPNSKEMPAVCFGTFDSLHGVPRNHQNLLIWSCFPNKKYSGDTLLRTDIAGFVCKLRRKISVLKYVSPEFFLCYIHRCQILGGSQYGPYR